jgi:hypothetical protein
MQLTFQILPLWILGLTVLASGCGQMTSRSSEKVSIKVVSKQDETPFFARLATNHERIVVAPSQSIVAGGHTFELPDHEDLFFVEIDNADAAKISSEIFRSGRVVVFSARDEREAFLLASRFGLTAHPRKIDLSEIKNPSAQQSPESVSNLSILSTPIKGLDIDPLRMREDLESLSGARPIVIDGQQHTLTNRASVDNKAKARAWLKTAYEALGFRVSEHRYSSGVNLVAEKRPANPVDDQIIMVSGHLDTVQTAGADDDGSGTISSLTIARALAGKDLRRTVRFVAFDEEERGLVGSTAYARDLNKSGEMSKINLINIEMTGYDSDNDGAFHTIDCNENTSSSLSQALLQTISRDGIPLKKIDACTNRSDHAVFWEYDRPAIVVSQNFFGGDGNPCYHRTCDTVQKVNWTYMEKMTRAAANTVYGLTK